MANEKRLIDANALRKEIDLCDIDTFTDKQTICEQIADAPTVDAVEVVRCKDCIWFSKNGYEDENSHEEDVTLHYGHCGTWRQETQACRFCAYGERREGE